MARDSSSGFRQRYHTFICSHKKYNRGSQRKRTNEQHGLRSAPSARRVVLWNFFVQLFVHLVDYRWECIFREISTKLLEMPTHLGWSSLNASFSWPLSTEDCWLILTGPFCCPFSTASPRLPSPTPLSGILFQLPSLSSPISGLLGNLESKTFVWFRAKKAKGIICPADHTHSVTHGEKAENQLFSHLIGK